MPDIKKTSLNKSISVKPQVFNTPLGVGDIGSSAKNAEKARVWAEGTDPEVETLGGEHSAKGWAEEAKKSAGGGKAEWGHITGTLSDQTDLQTALNAKQNILSSAQQSAVNSGIDSTKVEQISTNTSDITTIDGKIPAQATSSNQLADKNFVNSSIATNTANFIGKFNSVADLESYAGTLTNNDYAFVVGIDSEGNTVYNRYKYTTANTPASWVFEYALNNSSFTAAQWASINSGITSTAVTQIGTNTTNIASKQPSTLVTPISVGGVSQTTVEGALGAINTLAGKGVQNTATGTGSLSILGNSSSKSYSVNIGNGSNARGIGAVAMGNQANARENGAVAIGTQSISDTYSVSVGGYSQATGAYSVAIGGYTNKATQNSAIAIGSGAQATAQQAIQIGYGTNSTANTMQVFSHQLLDANGKIPNARLPYATSSTVGGIRISIDANNVVTIYTGD